VGLLQSYPQLAKVVKDNVSIDIPREQLSAWVDLALRIQKGGSIRSLPFTSDVVHPGNPDFARIRALVKKSLKPPASSPTPSASPSPTATPTKTAKSSTPTPTATPDDSKAVSLAATC
jgi:polyisoprenyl-teichoic acid--peptidoglycan teichoic acid transferase